MLRMGKLPILISGIEIQKETRVVKEHEIVNKKEINGIDDTMKTVVNYVQLDMIHITQFVKKAVNRFKFSAERQWKAMGNLFNKSRDHLPQRIYM